ncbi:MAG TPA: rhomboid family intramembrane serine protease, partial [Blastocatellia bacterium]|nr:rhomboid family intramembrane serine protease [Blastocatellia bacterium]
RGLIEASVRTCPLCGRDSVPALRVADVERSASPHFISRLFFSVNIVLYVLMVLTELNAGRPGAEAVFEGASWQVLADFGSCIPPLVFHGQWWRLVTPNFLHLGLIHLLFNSVCLYLIGPQVEEVYGSQKFIVIYLTSGIFSMLISTFVGFGGGGASGSLSGLIGLLAAYGYRLGGPFGRALMRQMLFWAVINILPVSMFGSRINWVAHAAGTIAGGALGFVISSDHPSTASAHRLWNILAIACAVVIMISFVMVATNYGKFQRAGDVRVMWDATSKAEAALRRSTRWNPQSGPPAEQVAAELRAATSGLEKVPSIDQKGDSIRRQWVDLLKRRSALFEHAAADPKAPVVSAGDDDKTLDALIEQFNAWYSEQNGI